MNIYEMYEVNGNKTGFWVMRSSWGNTIAQIKMVGNQTNGKLEGKAPYYDNPEVICELHDLSTGAKIQDRLKYLEKDGKTLLSSPGTYKYSMVDPNKIKEHFGWHPDKNK